MNKNDRPSAIAGSWYPGNPEGLKKSIQQYFDKIPVEKMSGQIVGLISPHAGYAYSGQVAAYGYQQLIGKTFDVVVILSPMHQMSYGKYTVHSASNYVTPLGKVPVYQDFLRALSEDIPLHFVDRDSEHSIEIQLPFLQITLNPFLLVPIMIGSGDFQGCEDLIEGLARLLKSISCLVVASSDLHHIPDYHQVKEKDAEVIEVIETFDLNQIRETLHQDDCSVCGRLPIYITLSVLKQLGATDVIVLNQANSGDITGDRSPGQYTVGYLSAAVVRKNETGEFL